MSFASGFYVYLRCGKTHHRQTFSSLDAAYEFIKRWRAEGWECSPPQSFTEPDNVIPLQRKETA